MISLLLMILGTLLLFAFTATFLIGGIAVAGLIGILVPIAIITAIIKFLFFRK
jgi:hypothetical protein|nr:MAG TPA: transmembrane domain protein [Caudoviricetes sp.]